MTEKMMDNSSENITYRVVKSRQGAYTLVFMLDGREYPLHSMINPLRESKSLEEKFNPALYDTLIVLGAGLGYHLVPLSDSVQQYKRIIIIDVLKDIERSIATNPPVSFLTSSDNVVFLTGEKTGDLGKKLKDLIDLEGTKGIQVLEHPASFRFFSLYYTTIKDTIENIIQQKAGNAATKKAFGRRYLKNIIRNVSFIEKCSPVSDFFNGFDCYPALVITAGPSLDASIDEIARTQHCYFIIAVDSALPVLMSSGIRPDFLVSIDPQPFIYEHFAGLDPGEIVSVLSISVHSSVMKHVALHGGGTRSRVLVSMNTHPLSQVISAVSDVIGSIDSGTGTVAGDALSLACELGFNTIGMIGFDFSFPSWQIYARGTAYQNRYARYFQSRLVTVEGRNMDYVMRSSRGFRYEGRYTRKSFIGYKERIEDFLFHKNSVVYSVNPSGIAMKGVGAITFKKFIAQCTGSIDKKACIARVSSTGRRMEDVFERGRFKDRLHDTRLFSELMMESLGTDRESDKYMKLVDALL